MPSIGSGVLGLTVRDLVLEWLEVMERGQELGETPKEEDDHWFVFGRIFQEEFLIFRNWRILGRGSVSKVNQVPPVIKASHHTMLGSMVMPGKVRM